MGRIVTLRDPAEPRYPSQRVRDVLGTRRVAEICGRTSDAIRKWDRARSTGGGGGLVPAEFQARLLRVAQAEGLPLTAEDLIADPRP